MSWPFRIAPFALGHHLPGWGVPHVLALRGHGIAAHAKEPEPSVAYGARQQRQQQQRAVEARHGAGGNFSTVSEEFREDIPCLEDGNFGWLPKCVDLWYILVSCICFKNFKGWLCLYLKWSLAMSVWDTSCATCVTLHISKAAVNVGRSPMKWFYSQFLFQIWGVNWETLRK